MAAVLTSPIMVRLTVQERRELERHAAENARSLSAELRYAARLVLLLEKTDALHKD